MRRRRERRGRRVRNRAALLIGVLLVALLLVLNAIVVSNQTRDAELTAPGGELVQGLGGELQVRDEGPRDGQPIVLLHGTAGSMHWFDRLAPLLSESYRVIRVDLLGHGGSEAPAAGYEIEEHAAVLASVLGRLEVREAVVVGHSYGAVLAVALAEESERVVSRIVNIAEGADRSLGELSFVARLAYEPVIGQTLHRLARIAPDSIVRRQFNQAFGPDFSFAAGFEDPSQPVDDLRQLTHTAYVESHEAGDDYRAERPLDERLAELGLPLLVIFGAEDEVYEAEPALDAYRDVPGARAVLLPQVGHSPQVEDPEAVARLVLDFTAEAVAEQRRRARAEAAAERRQRAQQRQRRAQRQRRGPDGRR